MTTVKKGMETGKIICISNVAPWTRIVMIMLHGLCFICWLLQYLLSLYSLLNLVIHSSKSTKSLTLVDNVHTDICQEYAACRSPCSQCAARHFKRNKQKTIFLCYI